MLFTETSIKDEQHKLNVLLAHQNILLKVLYRKIECYSELLKFEWAQEKQLLLVQ